MMCERDRSETSSSSPKGRDEIKRPTSEQIKHYAARYGTSTVPDRATQDQIYQFLGAFERLEKIGISHNSSPYGPRDPGRESTPTEDPHNAIIRFCDISGADDGPLAGMRIGVKDNIAVAGVPMTEGRRGPLTAVPTEDAVVVERLLDAGARIVAKTNLTLAENPFGEPRNPRDSRFSAGASSSGSAVAVVDGIVDAALGSDQGGSIRGPAAHCGIVGMKATHGLVPTHGLMYWDHTLDHIGPLTSTVADNAAVLDVIAGGDWRDPHGPTSEPARPSYTVASRRGIEGLRVGIIVESLESSNCTLKTLEAFDRVQKIIIAHGADAQPTSVPIWVDAPVIWLAGVTFSLTTMRSSLGHGPSHLGRVDIDLLATAAAQYRLGLRDLPWLAPILPIVSEHLKENYLGTHFGHAQNARCELRQQIDRLFDDFDVLITPTTPIGPAKLDSEDDTVGKGFLDQLITGLSNTSALNLSGHPALTVPSGLGDNDLPTGVQIIGRRFDEFTVYRVAFAIETSLS